MHFSDDISTTNDKLNKSVTQFTEEAVKKRTITVGNKTHGEHI